jgi:hypothetical protein
VILSCGVVDGGPRLSGTAEKREERFAELDGTVALREYSVGMCQRLSQQLERNYSVPGKKRVLFLSRQPPSWATTTST